MSVDIPAPPDFYIADPPYHLQQGDILQAVPLITAPAGLLLLRRSGDRAYCYPLERGALEQVPENLVDAFDSDRPEFIVVTAQRVPAVLMTPTCDLDKREIWLFSPLRAPEEHKDQIFAGKALSLFPIYAIPEAGISDSTIDVGDLRPVHKSLVKSDLRIKSMSSEALLALGEMSVRAQSRVWGYAPGELVPHDGKYRCARDNAHYDLKTSSEPVELKKGGKFPECPNCSWSHKSAQWYMLTKLKRRS